MSLAILFHFLCTQHVSDINIFIIRSLRVFCWTTTLVILFSVRCVLEIWCGWCGIRVAGWSLQHGYRHQDRVPRQQPSQLGLSFPRSKTTAVTIGTEVLRDPRQQPSQLGLRFSEIQDNSRHNWDWGSPRSKTTAVTIGTEVLRDPRQQPPQLGLRFSEIQDNSRHNWNSVTPVSNTKDVSVFTCPPQTETQGSFQKSVPPLRLHVVTNLNTAPLTVSSSHTGLQRTLVSTKLHALLFAHVVYWRITTHQCNLCPVVFDFLAVVYVLVGGDYKKAPRPVTSKPA